MKFAAAWCAVAGDVLTMMSMPAVPAVPTVPAD